MEIIWSQAILAGIVAAALMALAMFAGRIMGLSTDIIRVIGLFVVPEDKPRPAIYGVGLAVHFLVGAIFGIIYALLFTAVGVATMVGAAATWGIFFGILHGVALGAAAGMLPAVHPRMGGPEGVLQAPGFFGRNIGVAMPVALVLLHIIFGVTVGLVYSIGVVG